MKDKLKKYAELIVEIFGTEKVYYNQSILDYLEIDKSKDGLRKGLYDEVNKIITESQHKIKGCFDCKDDYCNTRRKDVPFWVNDLDDKIMIIAQDPGEYAYEEHKNQDISEGLATPLAADLFLIERDEKYVWYKYLCSDKGLGIDVEKLYITDISKCRDGLPKKCVKYLEKELCIVKPQTIIVMGREALNAFKIMVKKGLIQFNKPLDNNIISQLHGEIKECTIYCEEEAFKTSVLFMLHLSNANQNSWKLLLKRKNFESKDNAIEELRDKINDLIKRKK